MAIQLLDQNTINKIAAGEVIERPSSVVKELVENAIDAGATAVTVEIKEGGISFIRVTDNGTGIAGNELEVAFERHATSKIKSVEDLMTVSSLGFRGEALASIASVSQVELITKTADCLNGYRFVIEGGEKKSLEEIGAPDGTTFIVRNLFYNTPVRRKFLKSVTTEAGYIASLVQYLSLSHPDISFRFINNNQNKLHTSGNMNLKDIIYSVYGRDITSNLYEIDARTQDIEMTGFIGKPAICRGNRTFENYYINGRYIKSNIITKAIEDAYKGFIMPHNYPFTAIHFKINPLIMDVNVHPTKMELRFSNNEFVYDFIVNAVTDRLKARELVTRVTVDSRLPEIKQNIQAKPEEMQSDKAETKPEVKQSKNAEIKTEVKPEVKPDIKSASNPQPVNNCELVHDKKTAPASAKKASVSPAPADSFNEKSSRLPEPFEIKRSKEMIKEDSAVYNSLAKKEAEQMSLFENKLLDKGSNYRIIGQLFETYWLIEFEDKFYIMDQHAAHEKVLYEKLMKHLQEKTMSTQEIFPPVIVSFNIHEEEVLRDNMEILNNLGYEIEAFGGNEYKITGVPAGLPNMDYRQMLIDIVDGLLDDARKTTPELITEKVASMSCKAAVKGNNRLSFPEVNELMNELMKADNPYNCPHGRPTLIMMTKYDIERKFKRII
ncbi:MAG: DNA mismatch repair endonuclease MutL [Lachnospira sp.]